MAVCWHGDDDGRPVVTPSRWLSWCMAAGLCALLMAEAALLCAWLILPAGVVDAWLCEVLR